MGEVKNLSNPTMSVQDFLRGAVDVAGELQATSALLILDYGDGMTILLADQEYTFRDIAGSLEAAKFNAGIQAWETACGGEE